MKPSNRFHVLHNNIRLLKSDIVINPSTPSGVNEGAIGFEEADGGV